MVGHRTFSDRFMYLSEQNSMIGRSVQTVAHSERARLRVHAYVYARCSTFVLRCGERGTPSYYRKSSTVVLWR